MSTARQAIPRDKLLVVGTDAESTRATIERTRAAAEAEAEAALVMAPYYSIEEIRRISKEAGLST
jgi:4-hydroxy-2-oxoglutarate aldolase